MRARRVYACNRRLNPRPQRSPGLAFAVRGQGRGNVPAGLPEERSRAANHIGALHSAGKFPPLFTVRAGTGKFPFTGSGLRHSDFRSGAVIKRVELRKER